MNTWTLKLDVTQVHTLEKAIKNVLGNPNLNDCKDLREQYALHMVLRAIEEEDKRIFGHEET